MKTDSIIRDEITGLPVLQSVFSIVDSHLQKGSSVGFLYFDVVQFHIIKEIYGRKKSEILLKSVGKAFSDLKGKFFREDDMVAIGGPGADYFAVLLISPPRRKNKFLESDLKIISQRLLQHLCSKARNDAKAAGIDEKIDFYTGYSMIYAEPGVSAERLVYEAQREAAMRAELDEIMVTFISNVTHELRTPLTCIKGYSETLLDGALENAELAKRWLEVINQEAKRLERLINDLSDISMIEAQQAKFFMAKTDVSELLQHIASVESQNTEKAQVSLKIECQAKLPLVLMDRDRISQVLVNLIDNAIKFSEPGSVVKLKAFIANESWLHIQVIDHGVGIPDTQLSRVFERFYKISKGHGVMETKGRGLGLAIAKRIAEAHRGTISVNSEVGKGSIFTLELPLDNGDDLS
ncbi:MAG: diguanylate cyclase [bacterium]|nr:diguanylate cyclase [bacterium]